MKAAAKFNVGDKVELNGVKDAVITTATLLRGKRGWMYQVEYTVDDELERANPTGRRYTQPWMENDLLRTNKR